MAHESNVDPAELAKFNELAHRWWDPQGEFRPLHEINPLRLAWIAERAPLEGKTALDVGCGGGILAEAMAQRGARVTGIDLGEKPLRIAKLHTLESGVQVQGIFETTGSETSSSELTPLFCAGLPVRQDGNPFILHHKVFIVDNDTVITGSFNISSNATNSNDENLLVIQDPALAAQYIAEFERRWAEAIAPSGLSCR